MNSTTLSKIAAALAKAQGELKPAKKDSTNPHFRSRYADFASVVETVRIPLSSNGLAFVQTINEAGDVLTTMLIHAESGEYITSYFPLLCEKRTAQGIGSAITYAKRYALSALVGLATDDDDDDDGHEASNTPPHKPTPSPAPKAPPTVDLKRLKARAEEAHGIGAIADAEYAKFTTISVITAADYDRYNAFLESRFLAYEKSLKKEQEAK